MVEGITRLMQDKRILIVGDAMTDIYIRGALLDSQDGCKKFVEYNRIIVPGGAANAERQLKYWPCTTHLYHAEPICVKTRYIERDTNTILFRHDLDRPAMRVSGHHKAILAYIHEHCPNAVLISDYDKGLLEVPFLRNLINACKEMGIIVVADAKREPAIYAGAIIKGNKEYFQKWAEKARTTTSTSVATMGGYTPIAWDKGVLYVSPNLPPVNCINHVGAGDCFAAHLTLALACGLSLNEACTIAHSAGRVYVQHPNNRPPKPSEVEADLFSLCKE